MSLEQWKMKQLRNPHETKGGWICQMMPIGQLMIRASIVNAIFHETKTGEIELDRLRILNENEKTWLFRAIVGAKVFVGVARLDFVVGKNAHGEFFAQPYVFVSVDD